MTVRTALRQASKLLDEAAVPSPRLTAEVLLCRALGCERSYLYGHPEEELSEAVSLHFERYLRQRAEGKPTQYITRKQEFYGREFLVTPDVLIPRPETEHVVEKAIALGKNAGRILDVGCGSGAIAVTLSLELNRQVWATDISPSAIAIAAENARRLRARVHVVLCDLASAIAPRSIDLIVCNPPYVALGEREGLQREVREHEPRVALFAGETGMEVYERLIADAPRVLRSGGWLVVELGFKASEPVRHMLASNWQDIQVMPDLAGFPRVLAARLTS
jgi:release factor glutamine methyltransferase